MERNLPLVQDHTEGLGEKRSNQDLNTGLPTSIGFLAIVFYSIIGACKRNSEMSLILEF